MPLVEVQLIILYKYEIGVRKKGRGDDRHTVETGAGAAGGPAPCGCRGPALAAYLFMHMAGGRGGGQQTQKGVGGAEKESRRANISRRTKPATSGEPQRDRSPGSDSCDGVGRADPEGGFAPGSGHIEDSGGSSPAVTPCIRHGGAQRRVEAFGGTVRRVH